MSMSGYIYLAANVMLSLLGALAMKWRAESHSPTAEHTGRIAYLVAMMLDPWVILSLALAALAMLAWMSALERVELSRAFAFTALIYVLVPVCSWLIFRERITALQMLGVVIIAVGVVVAEVGRAREGTTVQQPPQDSTTAPS
ncbi:drug/metabolite transporter (DMT)-like permease [Angulomicrobium tetraedrale]|uniref:Drug/metabolite transporter (DMT)-like permease n=1 Tax=Ancylobacter tetraedralis TaxID=217068 RepID=A0A839Z6W3_9HYPH|nr:EamA family transporter [Ancylobacter tetraedralis]MBB3770793.1 drug/metabolite transporter (DMT)-like permease [Ancylobacter tetraedralis]